ncbi:MAG: APC family permease [Candidatus Parvarchaeum sp.]
MVVNLRLEPNQVSVWKATFYALATILPFGVFGFAAIGVITYTPFAVEAFVVGFLVTLVSIAIAIPFSKKITNAGGWAAYAAAGLGKQVGYLTGWAYAGGYTVSTGALAATTGYLASVFLLYFDKIVLPLYIIYLIDISVIIVAFFVVQMRVKMMTLIGAAVGIIEVASGIIIAIAIIVAMGGHNSIQPLYFPKIGDFPSFFVGFIVGALGSYAGYGTIITLSEEARLPKKNVGKALLLTVSIAAVVFVLGTYAIVAGWGFNNLSSLVSLTAPGYTVIGRYLGYIIAIYAIVLLVLADYGTTIGLMGAASRVYFALGREKIIHPWFSTLNRRLVPGNSSLFIAVVGGILAVGLTQIFVMVYGAVKGVFYGVAVLGLFGTFVLIFYHLTTSISMPLYFRKIGEFKFYYIILPIIAIVAFLTILYYSLVGISMPLLIMPIAVLVWLVGGIFLIQWNIKRHHVSEFKLDYEDKG